MPHRHRASTTHHQPRASTTCLGLSRIRAESPRGGSARGVSAEGPRGGSAQLCELIKDEGRDWGPIRLEFSAGAFRLEVGDKIVAAAVRRALKKHGFSAG